MDPQAQAAPKDAIDDFIALPQEQQLSTLQTLAPEKQDMLLSKVKERRSAPPAATPSTPSLNDRLTQPVSDEFSKAHPILGALSNFGGGAINAAENVVMHPINTVKGTVQTLQDVGNVVMPDAQDDATNAASKARLQAIKDDFMSHPAYAAGGLVGGALGGEALGAGLGAVTRGVPKVLRGGADILADTGPKTAKRLVSDTMETNAAATEKAAGANADLNAARAQDLQKHFERTQAAKQANDAAAAAASRKAALQRGVETLDPLHKTDLQNLEGTVRTEANRRYNELNGTLDKEPANVYQPKNESGKPEGNAEPLLPKLLSDASENMKGSNTETPIMKDMEKRMLTGDDLTYRDLQGYRSEIGRELQKGSLPGDVYKAYKDMQETITDAMSDIAKARGLGDAFDEARGYYKKMSDTFDDPSSPIRKAIDSPEVGGVVKAFKGKDKSGIEALAQYDPDLAQRINTTRGYAAEAMKIKPPTGAPKVAPPLAPKPPQVQPNLTQLGPEDIQSAKIDSIFHRADKIRNTGHSLANTIVVLDTIRNLIHGNLEGIGTDIGARGGLAIAQHGLAAALERPAVVNWLTKPSAADLQELSRLPATERSAAAQNLQPLIEAAQRKGLVVNPAIRAITGGVGQLPAGHPVAQSAPLR